MFWHSCFFLFAKKRKRATAVARGRGRAFAKSDEKVTFLLAGERGRAAP